MTLPDACVPLNHLSRLDRQSLAEIASGPAHFRILWPLTRGYIEFFGMTFAVDKKMLN